MNFLSEREASHLDNDDIRHESDDDDHSCDSDNEDHEHQHNVADVGISNAMTKSQVVRSNGNTGPKGVMADYAEYKELVKVENELKYLKTQYLLEQMALSGTIGQVQQTKILKKVG